MAVIYAGILRAIEGQNYDVFSRRAALGTVQKLARLPRAWRLSRRTDGQAVPEVF
jgi:phytoene/squalene synthetase